ncbi:flagellar hook-associated protein 1 [bacterium BMS3Bbin12]|nr:flagellar hook-associated protein 1 [bacterium BMS3Bbin12]GBE50935.1 flagellar hook-associated protein 1 [bacterium BMS3Bbin13]
MGDILGNGVSALLAFQRSLATVSHNISNVNTPGYTRQRTDLSTRPPQFTGVGYIGTGVQVTGIERVYDAFLNRQVVTNTAAESQLAQFHQLAGQVDNLLGNRSAGLSASLQRFFGALQDVADDPTSTAVRQTLLSSGQSLVQTFHTLSNQLNSLSGNVNQALITNATDITGLARGVAKLNGAIVNAQGVGSGITPNDLLDQRDALVTNLAKLVGVSTVKEDNGALDVYIGSGQALVVGLKSATLSTVGNTLDPSRKDLTLSFGGPPVVVTDQITGGRLGGMLQFRKAVLDPAFNGLGRIAFGLARTFNNRHRLGMDLKGRMGGDFFTEPQPQVLPAPGNGGSVAVTVADTSKLTTSDYRLTYNGSAYTLTRLSDGQTVPLTGSGTTASPFTADGLSIVVGAGAAAGDQYLIRPTHDGAAQIGLAITEPDRVAAAAPVRIGPAVDSTGTSTNTGTGAFGKITATAAATLPLSSDVTFTYDSTTKTFSYSGGASGSFAYDPATDSGKTFTAAGINFTVTGTPADGDKFVMSNNTGGVGDNRNALLLGGLQGTPLLVGATATYSDAYGQLVADVGSRTQQSDIAQKAQAALLQQAQQARSSVSGVNLDEEAAKMIRFQQAYQAAARIITVSDTIFQTLLNAVR